MFHLAATNGQMKVVKWLINKGAHEVAKGVDEKQRTVMHVAAKRGELEILSFLQDAVGYDLRATDCEGQSVLRVIPRFGDDKDRLDECRKFVQQVCSDLDRADRSRDEMRAKLGKK